MIDERGDPLVPFLSVVPMLTVLRKGLFDLSEEDREIKMKSSRFAGITAALLLALVSAVPAEGWDDCQGPICLEYQDICEIVPDAPGCGGFPGSGGCWGGCHLIIVPDGQGNPVGSFICLPASGVGQWARFCSVSADGCSLSGVCWILLA